ncbi:LruC domain-containing protein [Pseudoalteromonas sp.]|uniref:LruC domain-containing protein n=1 Tax=Pseudoalteromonas sp. TaxID=53249 RepID=UPI00356B099C
MSFSTFAVDSVQFEDTIKQGYGNINLFTALQSENNLNAADLESLRNDHGDKLVFAVDINESASGTEKASTQGVALDTVELIVVRDGVESRYSEFYTATTSLIAPINETTRSSHFTMIGETGSSRISSSTLNDITLVFDSLLSVVITDSLANVDSAFLVVRLKQTNKSLGDPEAFYDYTGGFEDIAIVNPYDAQVLAKLAPGVAEAPLVVAYSQIEEPIDSWVYYPSSTTYFVVAYEDRYPLRGDYDFNDLVVGYRVGFGIRNSQVSAVIGVGYMIARGASVDHDWYLHIPFSNHVSGNATINLFKPSSSNQVAGYPSLEAVNGKLNLKLFANTKALMKVTGSEFANTLSGQSLIQGHKFSFSFNLDTPLDLSAIPNAPYDPYLHVLSSGYEIHLSGNSSLLPHSTNSGESNSAYKDELGYPYALVVPEQWLPPLEYTDLGEAYATFLDYTLNSNTENEAWYLSPSSNKTKPITTSHWKW